MEKRSLLSPVPEQKDEKIFKTRSSHRRDLLLVVCAVAVTTFLHWLSPSKLIESHNSSKNGGKPHKLFSFDDIKPSKTLEFHDCNNGLKCARLEVPLDWNATDPTKGTQVALAIIKKPAKVSVTDPRYGGVVLLNPGGPGGSGIRMAEIYADEIQTVVDAEDGVDDSNSSSKYFDILSWDPRGVNNTTPRFSCIPDYLTQQRWEVEVNLLGFYLWDPKIYGDVWARERARAKGCADLEGPGAFNRVNGNEHLGRYMSTANVVRDMVEIIERHAEWREKEAKKILWDSRSKPRKGTVLGQSFATLQPHRVGRLVLDGVVDAQNYADLKWTENINDIDKETIEFTIYCAEAGPKHCALGDRLPKDIFNEMNDLLRRLVLNPLPAYTKEGIPRAITASNVALEIFNAWYTPTASFKRTASIISDLVHGNVSSFATRKDAELELSCPSSVVPLGGDRWSNSMSFACNDGPDISGETKQEYLNYVQTLVQQSDWFGLRWALIRLPCLSYTSLAKWRFSGPFGAKTANPILFASQQFDPVTPLKNAVGAVDLFPGSGYVVALGGLGHTTLAMPSLCTAKTIRRYFQTGEVPGAGGAQCHTEGNPFLELDTKSYHAGDAKLLNALQKMTPLW